MDQPAKTYPAREFPNLPSLEESQDLWRNQVERYISDRALCMMSTSFLVGVVILLSGLMLSVGRFELTINDARRETEALYLIFSVGCFLLVAPMVFIAWVAAQMPPRPTKESHQKDAEMMRLYELMKEGGGDHAS